MILNISIKNWKLTFLDFPGGPVAKSLPANAGDTSSIPGLGRFHIPRGNQACAPWLLKPTVRELHKRSHCDEKHMCRKEEQPPLAETRGGPGTATETQHSQKQRNK